MTKRSLAFPIAVIAVGLGLLAGVKAYLTYWASQPLALDDRIEIVIEPGDSFTTVVETLDRAGAVTPRLFSLRAKERRLQVRVQSGEYAIVPGETADGLLDRLASGDVVSHRFRVEEGSNMYRLLARLASDSRLEFDLPNNAYEDLLERLGLPSGHPEGRFFPDTYQFARGYRASALLRRAYRKMEAELADAWRGRSAQVPYASSYDALTLASIVEKETAASQDRARVAGVFVRRLAKGMRLQSDPTVIYGLGDAYDGNLTRRHLDTDGPYNTYRRHGLPPTPIAFPSRAAIDAALHPDDSDALYFVSRGDGTSQFSATLAEHNAAVRRFQLR